jgi:hypothetical protein
MGCDVDKSPLAAALRLGKAWGHPRLLGLAQVESDNI